MSLSRINAIDFGVRAVMGQVNNFDVSSNIPCDRGTLRDWLQWQGEWVNALQVLN